MVKWISAWSFMPSPLGVKTWGSERTRSNSGKFSTSATTTSDWLAASDPASPSLTAWTIPGRVARFNSAPKAVPLKNTRVRKRASYSDCPPVTGAGKANSTDPSSSRSRSSGPGHSSRPVPARNCASLPSRNEISSIGTEDDECSRIRSKPEFSGPKTERIYMENS